MSSEQKSTSSVNEEINNVQVNTTDLDILKRDEKLAAFEIGTLSVIFTLAVFSNLFMLIAIWRQRRNRPISRMYFFMMHLSFADLLVAIFNILPQLAWEITYRFQGGDLLCRFVKYSQIMTLYLSTYILMFMAIDRYRAVCYGQIQWKSLKVAKSFVLSSYIISFVLAIPQAVIFHEEEVAQGVTDCWVNFIEPWGAKAYVSWFVFSIFAFPLIVIGICYGIICRQIWIYSQSALIAPPQLIQTRQPVESRLTISKIRRWFFLARLRWQKTRLNAANKSNLPADTANSTVSSEAIPLRSLPPINQSAPTLLNNQTAFIRERTSNSLPYCCHRQPPIALRRSNSSRITKAKIKTIKLTFTVVVSFIICWTPFCFTQIYVVVSSPENQSDIHPIVVIMLLLASLNSCTNPWIYLAFSGSLLNQMRVFFGLHWQRGTNDNDSIGEDDRRGGGPPIILQPQILNRQRQPRNGGQRPLPASIRCLPVDVVIRLKSQTQTLPTSTENENSRRIVTI